MDAITRALQDHREIADTIALLEQSLGALTKGDVAGYAEQLEKFNREYIVEHFRWEEEELFPEVLANCGEEGTSLVQELQAEHPRIVAAIATAQNALCPDSAPGQGHVLEAIQQNRECFDMLVGHARKEDDRLLPILRRCTSG